MVGLTPHHHEALLAIQGFPGRDYVTMGELAERLQVRHNGAVGLVDRLVAEALVERRPADSDRRQVYVTLTPRGKELLARLSAVHRTELLHIGPQLTSCPARADGAAWKPAGAGLAHISFKSRCERGAKVPV